MFCAYCGTRLPDDAVFCSNCGKRVMAVAAAAPIPVSQPVVRMKATSYDKNDMTSTLIYIKDNYGATVFIQQDKLSAYLSDLAPGLKNERRMLERMIRIGVFSDFMSVAPGDVNAQRRQYYKALSLLTDSEYIRQDIATTYLNSIADVFEWSVEQELPKVSAETCQVRFDPRRYQKESQDPDFVMGRTAANQERYEEAKRLFEKAYANGNMLACVSLGILYDSGYGCECDWGKALELFTVAMNNGSPLGANWLANQYMYGRGVAKNAEKAKELNAASVAELEKMAAAGCPESQYALGYDLMYSSLKDGEPTPQEQARAIGLLQRSMEQGNIGAGVELGLAYYTGTGVEADMEKGIRILEKYSDANNKKARYWLGILNFYGKDDNGPDYVQALLHFMAAAKLGHVEAQFYLGKIYLKGLGVQEDYDKALDWLDRAGDQGSISALLLLGQTFILVSGDEFRDQAEDYLKRAEALVDDPDGLMSFDYEALGDLYFYLYEGKEQIAFDYYCRAYELNGDAFYDVCYSYFKENRRSTYLKVGTKELLEAMEESAEEKPSIANLLGEIYEDGLCVAADKRKAKKWYEIAWAQGNLKAGWALVDIYVDEDENKIFPIVEKLYREEEGEKKVSAEGLLGMCYAFGFGVEENIPMGKRYLKSAADKGDESSADILKTL